MLPKSIQNLIEEFNKLPGIGPKTASRLVFYLLTKSNEDVEKFGLAISNLRKNLKNCQKCFNITEIDPCSICSNFERDEKILCIVEEPLDTIAIEKTGFQGKYHVLGGVISPIDDIGPDDLRISQLLTRLADSKTEEVIFATNPSLEGEATAMYVSRQIGKLQDDGKIDKKMKITRIARGLPIGGDLEYADEVTLLRALEGRREY